LPEKRQNKPSKLKIFLRKFGKIGLCLLGRLALQGVIPKGGAVMTAGDHALFHAGHLTILHQLAPGAVLAAGLNILAKQ
jgi:hypothetical protein